MHSLNSMFINDGRRPAEISYGPLDVMPDPDYSDMSCGDLVAELQLCIETQEIPPLDLTARLMGFGYDVEALIGDMSKITRH